jgi:hypothetical protein
MDDPTYREMLRHFTGKKSSRDLTLSQFRDVMDHMKSCGFVKRHTGHEFTGFAAKEKKWRDTLGSHRPDMATPAQLARIETDWDGMRWYWAKDGFGNYILSLRGFLKKIADVSDLRFLSFNQAHRTIDTIKAIKKRRPEDGERKAEIK